MKILLVDDHNPARAAIRALIEKEPDMTVVAEAETGEEALDKARSEHPDVVVMDILLPGMTGIDATRKIRTEQPEVRVLALSNHFGKALVTAILDAGGLGYVRKSRAFEELIPALRLVASGEKYVSEGAADQKS